VKALSRRALIRGAGSVAIALPWLEAMDVKAAPVTGPARRYVGVFQPGGTVRARYTPTGSEKSFVLSPILEPFQPMQNRLLVIDGLDLKSAVGQQHQSGIIALVTGTPQQNGGYAGGPSIDQVIAGRISRGKSIPSLQVAVRWATGKSRGLLSPYNAFSFEDNGKFSPIPPRLDPQQIFDSLFGKIAPAAPGAVPDPGLARKRSILDYVDQRYSALSARLGGADRQKLDQHLTKLRELEQSLNEVRPAGSCTPPARVDTTGYNPGSGAGYMPRVFDVSTDGNIPKVGKFMMDMLVTALACDLTAVATFQWTDTEAKHTFPWLNLMEHHHYYQHDGGFHPLECEQIGTWYAQQHVYLLQQMQAVDMGGHSLLDESVVFFGSELQEPPTHQKGNMPLLLAGGGGGLRTGRWVDYGGISHNGLLVSILNMFGDPRQVFGDPRYSNGPLPNIV
jgi:hypothetical protein